MANKGTEKPCSWGHLPGEITAELASLNEGDPEALNRVFELVYQQLRNLAKHHLHQESNSITLQPTELINEVYVRMRDSLDLQFANRLKFFSFSAFLMRRVLVQHARERTALKRGGCHDTVVLDEARLENLLSHIDPEYTLDLDRALSKLARLDPPKSQIAIMRYFAGLSIQEVAEILNRSARTVQREWRFARHWLAQELSSSRTGTHSGKK